jgi:hypothetical protein
MLTRLTLHPLTNTIFDDTRQAVLFQGKHAVRSADLPRPQNLAELLNHFYAHTGPEHEDFGTAVEGFKDRVPDVAHGPCPAQRQLLSYLLRSLFS